MTRLSVIMAIPALSFLALSLPALADEDPLPRTPWQKAAPSPEKPVRWVVEGCAAYPVTAEASETPSEAKIDLAAGTTAVISER